MDKKVTWIVGNMIYQTSNPLEGWNVTGFYQTVHDKIELLKIQFTKGSSSQLTTFPFHRQCRQSG